MAKNLCSTQEGRGTDFLETRGEQDRFLVFQEPLGDICVLETYPHFLVSDFFQDLTWNIDSLKKWVPIQVVQAILELLPQRGYRDVLAWNVDSSGVFSTKSAYELVRKRNNASLGLKVIWNLMLPLKVSFLSWRILNSFLPFDAQL